MTTVFETGDLDEAQAMLYRTYARMRISASGDRPWLRIEQRDLGPIGLHRSSFRMAHQARLPVMGMTVIGRMLAGGASFRTGSESAEVRAGDLCLAIQPDREAYADCVDHDAEYARFPPDVFAQVADAAPGRAPRPVRFTGHRPVTARAAETWRRTHDYVRDTIAGIPAEQEPLLVGAAVRMLASVTLATFPNSALHDPPGGTGHDAHPATLRRAIAFIEDNADRDITPADVATAARVSIRSVQLAFRRHLGVAPGEYLRRVRLDRAHRQLLAADPYRTTVAAVAARWGFAGHSSFSAAYRAAYGVTPSQTLRGVSLSVASG